MEKNIVKEDKMKDYTINVSFQSGNVNSNFMELVQNDYNSTKLHFIFDTDNRVVMKMLYPDNTTQYITQIDNDELLLGPGVLSQDGTYQMELSSYSDTGRLTAYATMEFYVRKELVDSDELVEPDDRVPVLDNLINEVNTLDVTATKSDDIATITITRKDGTQQTVVILDGEKGDVGATPNIQIGAVTGGNVANVTITGTPENPLLNFVLPKGDKGDKGEKGEKGDPGVAGSTGDSGVRVSETEPTDPEVNVWINTSENIGGE